MKQKHRILSKKNKKVKQLMRRFQDESDNEDQAQNKHQQPKKGQVIKKNETNKKAQHDKDHHHQPSLKRKDSDRTNDSFDAQNQSDENIEIGDADQEGQKTKTTFSSVFSKILTQDVKKSSIVNPIFSEFNKPLKKVRSEIRKDRENQIKKRIKELKESRGHVIPQSSSDGAYYEKELKMQAAKGIIKILDAVKKYQDDEGIEN